MTRGEKLRFVRKQRGMTLEALSNAIGMSQSFISEAENDRSDLSIKSLEKICTCLNVNPSFFFDVAETTFESLLSATGKILPEEINNFILSENSLPYLELAKRFSHEGISIKEMEITLAYLKSIKDGRN